MLQVIKKLQVIKNVTRYKKMLQVIKNVTCYKQHVTS